jgi:UDP-N-acetylmuramoylalanine--D-glutamate ligase
MKETKNTFKHKKVAILGWGINGLDAYKFLIKQNAQITILDQDKKIDLSKVDKNNVELILGEDYLKNGLKKFDYVFRAPGVYRYKSEMVDVEGQGVRVTSAVKLFFELCPAKIIGVTGTKGKGTTASLIYQILKTDGKDVHLAGNIGKPLLELLPKLKKTTWVVLELSSFQLIDLTKSPHISVVLNITEDHLDWHKDKNEYVESKLNIVKYQKKNDFAVLNYDYATSKTFSKKTKAKVFYFSKEKTVGGAYVKNGKIILDIGIKKYLIGETKKLKLRGSHNWENVCAAVLAARLTGAGISSIKKGVFSFKGLEHRLKLVRKYNGISFYDDSFSTNPQTTIAAIKSFTEPITLILGGSDKGLDYSELVNELGKRLERR